MKPRHTLFPCAALALAASALPVHARILLTEINSNGNVGDYWEITNTGSAAVDLSGFRWTDSEGTFDSAAAWAIAPGTSIAAGESIVLTKATETAFRAWWGSYLAATAKVISATASPGLGQNDGAKLFDSTGASVVNFSYAAGGFTRPDGSASVAGHAGVAGGGTASQALVWDPASGDTDPRYTAATGLNFNTTASATVAADFGSPGYSGAGAPPPSVALTVSATPAAFSESAANPAATGSVVRTGATTEALIVNLSSSDVSEVTVPGTVTIPAGQSSANFDITAVDDTFPDGNKPAILTASATGATAGTVTVTVNDDGDVFPHKLMVTEILSQQDGSGEDFWELTNVGTVPADISGYSWTDSVGTYSAALAKIAPGTILAPGESIIFTAADPVAFRTFWGLAADVKVSQSPGAPGLGKNDGVRLFEAGGNEVLFVSYAAGGFNRADGTASIGGHAGYSASPNGSVETVEEVHSMVWVPASGTTSPRYTVADGVNFGTRAIAGFNEIGSPGVTIGHPTVSIGNVSIAEGDTGTTGLNFTVTRSDASTAFDVSYAVTGGTATAGEDYTTLVSGVLNFTAGGPLTLPITVSVTGDTVGEPDETIQITLSGVVNATGTTILGTSVGTGTIVNDDVIAPVIGTQPVATSIAGGGVATLSIAAGGFPAPTVQWYIGETGDTSNPVAGATSATFTTPALTASTRYWARVTNSGGSVDSASVLVTVVAGATEINLASYVRVGRYNLPEPTRTALPAGTPSSNLLCQEASGVAYNWDTDTLFICGDGGRAITQVSKTGALIDTMTLALNAAKPQGTEFYDPEGITYIGNGEFVFTEERERQIVRFTYQAGATLTRANAKTVDLGTFDDNTGTEGLSWDPLTGGFVVLKEKNPIGVFQTNVDFNAGTATNGSPTTVNSTNLFDTTLLGMTDVADVFALSNLPTMDGQPQQANLLVLGQENARIVNISRSGVIHSTLNIASDPGNPLSPADQQHEGLTMDRAGNIYVVNENGGGGIDYPQLWVYAPSSGVNLAPTAIALNNTVTSLQENTSTASPVKVADIVVTDDGLGTNALALTGADAASFEITGSALYLKAGVNLDYETKTNYAVAVSVDDAAVGATPDASVNFTLTVTDQVVETPAAAALVITEVAPWSSGNSPVAADWFEVTNVSANPVDVTGWKVDDSSAAFASALALNGITTIAPGESVIFIETADPATTKAAFLTNWFGANPPAGLQIGSYTGGSIGLSTGGDEVNLYNAGGALQAKVAFGGSDAVQPYQTFDNTAALNNVTLAKLSETGVNGAFVATNSANEVGSPGYSAPALLRVTEVAPWSSGNSPVAADWFEVTNTGGRAADITGWKVDDSSESPAAAVPLSGITRIAPGESVIFIETTDLATKAALFKSTWFGANSPAALQIGAYAGSGIGLSTGGDAVNLYDTASPTPVRRASVSFGIAPSSAPFGTFDNTAAADVAGITLRSVPGINGAFAAANAADEIGSPGIATQSGPAAFGQWLAAKGFSSRGFNTDSDGDGLTDGLEFFFNANPNQAGDSGKLPKLAYGANGMQLGFTRLTDPGQVLGELSFSTDLTSWTPAISGFDYTVASTVVNGDETTFTYDLPGSGPSAPGTSPVYLTPNTSDPLGASLGGVRVVNEGLVGVGRLSGENVDKFGETQGAASGLFITDWAYAGGKFSGTFNVLPDRGYGDGTSNYAARLHKVDFTFAPYYGAGPVAQDQVKPVYADSTKFTYQDGGKMKFTTGLNPSGTSTLFGQTVGTVTAANGEGGAQESLLSMDAEAVHLFEDGSGFMSDEYGTYIARFNKDKEITGITQLPGAAQPFRPAGTPNFDSLAAPTTGRRNNQGLEGMAVTPDGTRLFALLQSATVQDTNGSQQQTRNHARLFVYDIAGANREHPVIVGEYVVKLPQIDLNSDGSGADGTAAQSEIVALGGTSFLMLPRDGNGLGKGTAVPILFKSVQLVDFASATNILGQYDGVGQQISPAGVLRPEIQAAATGEVINMLQPDDLAKFGLNTTIPANANTLNEKIEGMALVPDLSTPATNDFFLFVANDNDFQSSNVKMVDAAGNLASRGDGRLNAGITNDAMFYIWRLSIGVGSNFFRFEVK